MFFGAFNLKVQEDGLIFKNFDFSKWIDEILEHKGQTCHANFYTEYSEIVFDFIKEESYEEACIPLYSFVVGDSLNKIKKQFYIPNDYMKYYPDKIVRLIGLDKAFCLSRKESENEIVDFDELKRLLLESDDKND